MNKPQKFLGGIVAVGYVHSEDPWNTFFTWGEGHLVFLMIMEISKVVLVSMSIWPKGIE